MEKLEFFIEKEEYVGIRIDKALSELNTDISRATVQRLIEEGRVQVNGKTIKASYKLQSGDKIDVEIDEPKEVNIVAQDIPLDIIYEDKDILVINKQKGLVVHPGNGNPDGTLVNAILNYCKDSLSGIGGEIRPGIVHKSHVNLSEQIKNHEVKKTYIALVRGNTKENQATIDMPIARSTKDRTKMAVSKNGKNAVTHFKVLERFDGYTLLEVNIETGRTHQIRVHLAQIGYPIVGDSVYSNGKNPFGVEGQMLHSYKLKFKHPISGKDMELEAPLPKYFIEVLDNIRP